MVLQGKEDRSSTIKFLSYMDTFFDCLNVSNRFDGVRKRKGSLAPYTSMDDCRFKVKNDVNSNSKELKKTCYSLPMH